MPWAASTAAAAPPTPNDIASGLAGPLQIAVGTDGTLYIGESFAGQLTTISKKGDRATLASGTAGGEVAGVDAKGKGTAVFLTSNATESAPATVSQLVRVQPNGRTSVLADLLAYENNVNPDQINTYGFVGITPECAEELPPELGPPTYTGILESHPYAVAIGNGAYFVADAAANAILRVGANGSVSTAAVLPPQPVEVTDAVAAALGLPDCAIGSSYNFEPVPTDVEIGNDGMLYVTTLPGGPEDPSLGARGSVYRVDPNTGAATLIATGFTTATNLAIDSAGTIYVTELFGGQVSKIVSGVPVPFVSLPFPAAIEFANGQLYVAYDVFGNGTVATLAV